MSSNTPTPLEGGPASSLKGWHALAYAVASNVPTSLKRAQLTRRASLRALARIGTRR